MYIFVGIIILTSGWMSALVNSAGYLMINTKFKKHENSFLKKIIKQEALNRWVFWKQSQIPDPTHPVYFRSYFRKWCTMTLQIAG